VVDAFKVAACLRQTTRKSRIGEIFILPTSICQTTRPAAEPEIQSEEYLKSGSSLPTWVSDG
jgi:hypothetical protein